jgi:hypothetical protein
VTANVTGEIAVEQEGKEPFQMGQQRVAAAHTAPDGILLVLPERKGLVHTGEVEMGAVKLDRTAIYQVKKLFRETFTRITDIVRSSSDNGIGLRFEEREHVRERKST